MNEISFKSKFIFVNRANFEKFEKGMFIGYVDQETLNRIAQKVSEGRKNPFKRNNLPPRLDIIKADEYYT